MDSDSACHDIWHHNNANQLTPAHRKKLVFYPEFQKERDVYLREFCVRSEGNSLMRANEKFDPSKIGFPQPDFGFNIYKPSTHEQSDFGGMYCYKPKMDDRPKFGGYYWRELSDLVAREPKYERPQNYIRFCNDKKIQLLTDMKLLPTDLSPTNNEFHNHLEKLRFLDARTGKQ
jgi:hypothetical protein